MNSGIRAAIREHGVRTGGVMVGDVIRVGAQVIRITECDLNGRITWENWEADDE